MNTNLKKVLWFSILFLAIFALGFLSTAASPSVKEIVYIRETIYIKEIVHDREIVEVIKNNPPLVVGFLDQQSCNINKFSGEKKQNIKFMPKPQNFSTENSSSSVTYVEKIVYVPGTNTTEIIYVPTTEIIYIEVPINNNKLPCNRGNKPENCDPGNSAGQGGFKFEKESNPKEK